MRSHHPEGVVASADEIRFEPNVPQIVDIPKAREYTSRYETTPLGSAFCGSDQDGNPCIVTSSTLGSIKKWPPQ